MYSEYNGNIYWRNLFFQRYNESSKITRNDLVKKINKIIYKHVINLDKLIYGEIIFMDNGIAYLHSDDNPLYNEKSDRIREDFITGLDTSIKLKNWQTMAQVKNYIKEFIAQTPEMSDEFTNALAIVSKKITIKDYFIITPPSLIQTVVNKFHALFRR